MNLFTILAVLFIALKLTGVIIWSWWLVLLPLYGGLVFFAICFAIAACLSTPWRYRRR